MTVIARAPLLLGQGSQGPLCSQVWRIVGNFWRILWQSFLPFNPRPEPPDNPPAVATVDDDQLKQCQALFAEAEADRAFLEGKARATFSVITFLVPLLTSGIVFLYAHISQHAEGERVALVILFASFALSVLGFISIARAVSVQVRETLGLGAIIDLGAGTFRAYDKVFYARGLLYCASVNQGMNGHIAQFVKGAHILTALAVLALLVAAVPSILSLPTDSGPAKTEIVGPVNISASSLVDLKAGIATLSNELRLIANDRSQSQRMDSIDAKIDQLSGAVGQFQRELEQLQKAANGPATTPKP
jgi:hypothetical protein